MTDQQWNPHQMGHFKHRHFWEAGDFQTTVLRDPYIFKVLARVLQHCQQIGNTGHPCLFPREMENENKKVSWERINFGIQFIPPLQFIPADQAVYWGILNCSARGGRGKKKKEMRLRGATPKPRGWGWHRRTSLRGCSYVIPSPSPSPSPPIPGPGAPASPRGRPAAAAGPGHSPRPGSAATAPRPAPA